MRAILASESFLVFKGNFIYNITSLLKYAFLSYRLFLNIRNIIIFSLLLLIYSPAQASENDDLKNYVENLIDEGYKIVNDSSLTEDQRYKKTSRLIRSHLHLDWMARYVLGRNRRIIEDEKINEFIKTYSDFVVKVYADLSNSYNGEKAVLKNIKKIDEDMFIVNMEIIRPSGQNAVKIDYLVHKIDNDTKNKYRVGDIITEGISILNSQQSEFNSIISTRGIDALITDLEQRTNKQNNSKQIKVKY